MPPRRQTPQEKKRLDYERERRGGYLNSVRAMRKGVPKKKRHQARLERQAVSNVLPRSGAPADLAAQMDAAETRLARHRGAQFPLKWHGVTLREWVEGKPFADQRSGRSRAGQMPCLPGDRTPLGSNASLIVSVKRR